MAYFNSFQQTFHAEDRLNKQSSPSEKKKHGVCSGFGDEGEARTTFCRGERDMKVSPNGNINIGSGVEGPWFWGGGEMPMPPNGMRLPWFMVGCHDMAVTHPVPPVPPMSPASPWGKWGRVDMKTEPDGAGKVHFGGHGRPLESPPAPQKHNKGPSSGSPSTRSKGTVTMDSDGVKEVHENRRHRAAPPSENINIDVGSGTPLFWGEGEMKLAPNANVSIGLGAGGHNSGRMSASINHHHGPINF